MAVALVQSTADNLFPQASGTGTSGTVTPTLPVSATTTNVVFMDIYVSGFSATPTLTTPGGWTLYASRTGAIPGFGNFVHSIYWRTGFTSASQAVAITVSPSASWWAVSAMAEYSGASTTAPIDANSGFMSNTNYTTTGTINGANLAPSQANCALMAFFATGDDFIAIQGATTGWTERGHNGSTSGTFASMDILTYNSVPVVGTPVQSIATIINVDWATPTLTGFELFIAPPSTFTPGYIKPIDAPQPRSRNNPNGFQTWSAPPYPVPAVLSRALPAPDIFVHGRYNASGWAYVSGVSIMGPSPQSMGAPQYLDAVSKGRYNANGWSWIGTTQLGPSAQPLATIVDTRTKGRYNANGWMFATGVHIAGPSGQIIVPQPLNAVAVVRRTDGWFAVFVDPIQGPSPQALATFLDAFTKKRYNPNGFSAPSGVVIVGPSPHYVPAPVEPKSMGRYNAGAFFAVWGNGLAGPIPGPTTKSVAVGDTGATVTESVQVTLPGTGGGPFNVPFFRGF